MCITLVYLSDKGEVQIIIFLNLGATYCEKIYINNCDYDSDDDE
jgi:hypothetical protein